MAIASFFPKGKQNFLFLVFGSVILDNSIELRVHQEYENVEDAIECYKYIRKLYPDNSDMDIQKQTFNSMLDETSESDIHTFRSLFETLGLNPDNPDGV